jgi:hypothetical protein
MSRRTVLRRSLIAACANDRYIWLPVLIHRCVKVLHAGDISAIGDLAIVSYILTLVQ